MVDDDAAAPLSRRRRFRRQDPAGGARLPRSARTPRRPRWPRTTSGCRTDALDGGQRPARRSCVGPQGSRAAPASARRTIARVIPLKMNRWKGTSTAQYSSPQTPCGCQYAVSVSRVRPSGSGSISNSRIPEPGRLQAEVQREAPVALETDDGPVIDGVAQPQFGRVAAAAGESRAADQPVGELAQRPEQVQVEIAVAPAEARHDLPDALRATRWCRRCPPPSWRRTRSRDGTRGTSSRPRSSGR